MARFRHDHQSAHVRGRLSHRLPNWLPRILGRQQHDHIRAHNKAERERRAREKRETGENGRKRTAKRVLLHGESSAACDQLDRRREQEQRQSAPQEESGHVREAGTDESIQQAAKW